MKRYDGYADPHAEGDWYSVDGVQAWALKLKEVVEEMEHDLYSERCRKCEALRLLDEVLK